MRKDLKIGMAIGAVLLVLVIVYFAVPNEGTDVAQNPADPAGADTTTQTDPSDTAEPKTTETPAAPLADATPDGRRTPGAKDPFEEKGTSNADWGSILDDPDAPITITPTLSTTVRERAQGGALTPPAPEAATGGIGTATVGATGDALKLAGDQTGGTAAGAGPATDDESVPTRVTSPESGAVTVGPREPATPAAGGARTHTVARGETFSSIASLVYKDERQYLAIQEANPSIDPKRLRPGTVITLPDPASVKSAANASESAAPTLAGEATPASARREAKPLDPATEYKVQSGDSLYKIALKRYGTSNMTDDLYELNKATIGNDSARLRPGMVLKLPPNPTPEVSAR